MPTYNIFPTPIYINQADDVEKLQEELAPKVKLIREGWNMVNPWDDTVKTSFKYGKPNVQFNDMPYFMEQLETHVREYIATCGPEKRTDLLDEWKIEIRDTWMNVSDKGDFQFVHMHSNNEISGCYYFDSEETTAIKFENPSPNLEFGLFPRLFGVNTLEEYKPKTGDFVLFPSYLKHGVKIHQEEKQRVSITFNIRLKSIIND